MEKYYLPNQTPVDQLIIQSHFFLGILLRMNSSNLFHYIDNEAASNFITPDCTNVPIYSVTKVYIPINTLRTDPVWYGNIYSNSKPFQNGTILIFSCHLSTPDFVQRSFISICCINGSEPYCFAIQHKQDSFVCLISFMAASGTSYGWTGTRKQPIGASRSQRLVWNIPHNVESANRYV